MVYLLKNSIVPKIVIGTATTLRLNHQITHTSTDITVSDSGSNALYYQFNISSTWNNLKDGQYDYYVLNSDGDILASGIAQKGAYDPTVTTYTNEKTIIQYGQ